MGIAAAVGVAIGAITTVSAALTTVAVVGAVVGVVGAVTKNPILSKIGMGLGLVGGIGALASAALGFGSTAIGAGASAAGEAAAGGAAAAGEAATAGAAGAVGEGAAAGAANLSTELTQGATSFLEGSMGISGGASAIGDAVPDVIGTLSRGVAGSPQIAESLNPAASLGADLPGPTAANPAIEAASSSAPEAQLSATGSAGGTAPGGTGGFIDNASTFQQAGASPVAGPNQPLPTGAAGAEGALDNTSTFDLGTTAASTKSPFEGILSFVDRHPGLAIGALQAGGSFLSGATQQKLDPAQVNALNAQAAQNQAAADLVNQQKANLAAPKAVASLSPVTGAPVPLIPPGSGFINQAPRIAVTGAPA